MRTGTPLWLALATCSLMLGGCKMKLVPTTASKVWCCATCPGYTKPAMTVAFVDHRGDGIPMRRVYISGANAALEYARDAAGAPLPRDVAQNGWPYVITGPDGKVTINFEMPSTFAADSALLGTHPFKFLTYLNELNHNEPLSSKEMKVTIAGSCQ